MRKYTKEDAIAVVTRCAENYRNELEGRNFLFVCMDRHKKVIAVEVSFHKSNYMHLTGLKPPKSNGAGSNRGLHANDFYQKCLDHKLSPQDFDFAEDGTTHMKIDVLPNVITKNLSANMIGNYNSARPQLYTEKIIGNIHACVGFTFDQKTTEYVPNTVLQEDIRDVTTSRACVVAVYRKDAGVELYEELTYRAKGVDFASITYPEQFEYLRRVCDISED